MKKALFITAVSACLLGASSTKANLIVNGGFETGDLVPWGNVPISAVVNSTAHSGTYSAQLGPVIGGIGQSASVIGGQQYTLSFWAKDNGASLTPQILSVHFGPISLSPLDLSGVVPLATFNPTTTWTEYTYLVTPATTGDMTVAFGWGDGLKSAFLDDVALTAVPEPTTMVAGALLLLPFGVSSLRHLRRKTNG